MGCCRYSLFIAPVAGIYHEYELDSNFTVSLTSKHVPPQQWCIVVLLSGVDNTIRPSVPRDRMLRIFLLKMLKRIQDITDNQELIDH